MSRIFLSHSSKDNAESLALSTWLQQQDLGDHFLDFDATRGLAAGHRWKDALVASAHRCEAIVCIISPAWVASRECELEFMYASRLGKRIFGVIVKPTPLESIPAEMTSEWQLCDLVNGDSRDTWWVERDPVVPRTHISFASAGLRKLKDGLERAGLDAATFQWPPPGQPDRAPYRGLKPLEVDDCAIFFGREASIVRGLDEIRTMRDKGTERLLVVLGASGSGKSSFVRAGLWPRLHRDSQHFVPLQAIRPYRAAITGDSGLVCALAEGLRRFGISRNRAEIEHGLEREQGLEAILHEIQQAAAQDQPPDKEPPTLVLVIDQGEELLPGDTRLRTDDSKAQPDKTELEAERFLQHLAALPNSAASVRVIAILAIRSDSFASLQQHQQLHQMAMRPFDLRALSIGEFKAVIEGPAARSTDAGRRLIVEPLLTERLLEHSQGADALPLLAFILERLYLEYGADGDLRLDEYRLLGEVQGAIEAAVAAAFDAPEVKPAIPADAKRREKLLHDAFIPWLATIDPDSGQRRRQIARWRDIPAASRPLIERLAAARLIVFDQPQSSVDSSGERTVEVAHEALLRQWPLLTSWLDAQSEQLQALEAVCRAATGWATHGRKGDWLVHRDARLELARKIAQEPRFERRLEGDGLAYIKACRALEDSERAKELEQWQLRREEQERTAHAQRRARFALRSVATLILLAGLIVIVQARFVSIQGSRIMVSEARQAFEAGFEDSAYRLAILAGRSSWMYPTVDESIPLLRELLVNGNLLMTLDASPGEEILFAEFSRDSRWFLTRSGSGHVRVWDSESGEPTELDLQPDSADGIPTARLSPDGRHVLVAADGKVQLWNAQTGMALGEPLTIDARLTTLALSSDLNYALTTHDDVAPETRHELRVWNLRTRQRMQLPLPVGKGLRPAAISRDGRRAVLSSPEEIGLLVLNEQDIQYRLLGAFSIHAAAFSGDGKSIALQTTAGEMLILNSETTERIDAFPVIGEGASQLAFSVDDQWLLRFRHTTDPLTQLYGIPGGILTQFDQKHATGMFDPQVGRAVSSGAPWLAIATSGTTIVLTNGDGPAATSIKLADQRGIGFMSMSPDSKRILTTTDDGGLKLWRVPDDARASASASEIQPRAEVIDAAISPNGRRIAFAGSTRVPKVEVDVCWECEEDPPTPPPPKGSLSLWDVSAGRYVGAEVQLPSPFTSVAFSNDSRRLATTGSVVKLWDGSTGAPIDVEVRSTIDAKDAQFNRSGTRLLLIGTHAVQICEAASGHCGAPLVHEELVVAKWGSNGSFIATGGQGGVRLWRAESGERLPAPSQRESTANSLAISPDSFKIVSGTRDGAVTTWTVGSRAAYALRAPDDSDDDRMHVAFSPDGRFLVARTSDLMHVWRTHHLDDPPTVFHNYSAPAPVWFTPGGRLLAAFDGVTQDIEFWDLPTGKHQYLLNPDDGLTVLERGPGDRWLLTVNMDSEARIVAIDERLLLDREGLIKALCEQHLRGATRVTDDDELAAPVLEGKEGEDVCRPPTLLYRWRSLVNNF